jgi:hypothetical protein
MNRASLIKRRYIRAMLDSYFPFLFYIGLFVAIFFFAVLSIRVDLKQTFKCNVITDKGNIYLVIDARVKDDFDHIYTYTEKNIKVYKVDKIDLKYSDNSSYIQVQGNNEFEKFLSESNGKIIRAEIPQGSISLLRRLIPLGEYAK